MRWRLVCALILWGALPIFHYAKFNDLGMVTFDVFGQSFSVNSVGFLTLFLVLYLLLRAVSWLVGFPSSLVRRYQARNTTKGIQALVDVFAARFLDDEHKLRLAISDLRRYGVATPVQKYYLARLAQSEENQGEYQQHVADLANEPQGLMFGYLLRVEDLLRQSNVPGAYQALKRMAEAAPYSAWVMQQLVSSACQLSNFDEAQHYLERMRRARLLSKEHLSQLESQILTLKAEKVPKEQGLKFYVKAVAFHAQNYKAAIQGAELAQGLGKMAKCREIIEQAWLAQPPFKEACQLASLYATSFPLHSEVEKLDYLQKLKELVPEYPGQFRVEAYFAIKAGLWSRARQALSPLSDALQVEDYLLLAEIEAGEGEAHHQTQNLEKALKLLSGYDKSSWATPERPRSL